jgi:signal transduction histidine kinase
MINPIRQLEKVSKGLVLTGCVAIVASIGLVDYLTGSEIYFSTFYLLPVALAAWFLGGLAGIVISMLSVAVWLAGDIAAGARYSSWFVPVWNGAIALTVYLVVVRTLVSLQKLQRELAERVHQRTTALTREIAERERLEKELLDISEREQRRIGHDLHDNFCQHLTSTAMAVQVLREKLHARTAPESDDAAKIVALVEEGIAMARELARGLSPVELEAEGLMSALRELAAGIAKWSKVGCVFECESPVLVHDATAAMNLYRITQEAVSNAVRHGKAQRIIINLDQDKSGITLSIEDDGVGLPENWHGGDGLGTRIMAHRAAIIGGTLALEPNVTGGTLVRCKLPATPKL